MRKLVLKMSMSLDGFVGAADGSLDWIFTTQSKDGIAWTVASVWDAGVHIMGSRTFHDMAAYWPTSREPFAPPMNEIPKAVFSRHGLNRRETTQALNDARHARKPEHRELATPTAAIEESWRNPYVASGDLADEIARLKAQPGKPIVAHGGASFARALVAAGLVDEYRLLVHPVILGKGLPIFTEVARPRVVKLDEVQVFENGAAAHVYRAV